MCLTSGQRGGNMGEFGPKPCRTVESGIADGQLVSSGRERHSVAAAEGATAPESLRQKGRKKPNTLERG
jgi:hypothetical protein